MDTRFKKVQCRSCKKTYICTPFSDYIYPPEMDPDKRNEKNGQCLDCLIKEVTSKENEMVIVFPFSPPGNN